MKSLADEGCSCADLSARMKDGDIEGYMLKPMNCPHHIQIYKSELRSYRDLPLRLAEFGTVYRYEKSGELGGLKRVRGFTVDDQMLKDIGVTRDEVRRASDLPLSVNAALELEAVARSRRSW